MAAQPEASELSYTMDSGIFVPGYRFPEPMTYQEICNCVSFSSCLCGGSKLCPHKRKGGDVPLYIKFYCQHGRDHGNLCGKKKGSNDGDKRANRSQSQLMRNLFTNCNFSMCVRRDASFATLAMTSEGNTVVKWKWFVDSLQDQEREGRYKICNNNFKHTGHIKRSLQIANVSEELTDFIKRQVNHNVSVGQIARLFRLAIHDLSVLLPFADVTSDV